MLRSARRIPRTRQHDATDCGAACLHSVAAFYGHHCPVARLRQLASTDRDGTSVFGLVEAAERMGFAARGVRGPWSSLARIPLPAIAHVELSGGLHHFVVLYRFTARHAVVMDPMDGRVHRMAHARFRAQWTGVLVLLVPGERFRPDRLAESPTRRFWRLLRPHRSVLAQALAGAVAYTVLGLATAVYVQKLVDHVLPDGDRGLLNLLGLVMLACIVAQVYLGWTKDVLALRTGQQIDAALILGYYRHLLRLPQRFFDTMRTGEILARVGDAVKIRALLNDAALELVVSVLVLCFSLVLMGLYSPRMALLVLALLPLYAGAYWAANWLNRRTQRQVMERAAELESQMVESLGAISTLKRLALEEHAEFHTEQRFVRLLRPVYRSGLNGIFAGSAGELLSRIATLTLLWVGAGQVFARALSPGELMSLYALLGYLTAPVSTLLSANQTVQDALIAADRLFEILDLEREEGEGRVELTPALLGDVRFEGVRFGYGAHARIFDDLTLELPRGRLTAVVGESGSGKSTLMALLHRLYPLERGRIRIGAVDLREVSVGSLRRMVGVVPQEVTLFTGTVLDNIAPGDPRPDVARVLEVCAELGLDEWLAALPLGLQTPVGEHGAALSGGQRQRLAIARALYRRPQVLVLDEATSNLDAAAEAWVRRAVARQRERGVTVLLIAHRLATVAAADRIVVLRAGRVAEQGTHTELLRQDGEYARLWRGLLPDAETPPPPALAAVGGGGAEPGPVQG